MRVVISTTRTINGDIYKFRVLCTKPRGIVEVEVNEIKSYLSANRVANVELLNGDICYTQGRIEDYPYETYGQMAVVNGDRYIYLAVDKDNVYLCDYKGTIKKCPLENAHLENFSFANIVVSGGNIELKNTSIPIDLMTGCSKQVKEGGMQYISLIRDSKNTGSLSNINLVGFNARDYAKSLGVNPDVFKTNSSIFSGYTALDLSSIERDKSAYSFDIVSIDGRVELRKYKGGDYAGLVEVPDKVTHICSEAFFAAHAKELVLPDSVVYLGDKAFAGSKFSRVTLSKNVTAIPKSCFFKSAIEEINLERIKSIGNEAFRYCSRLREVRVKGGVTQVGYSAFEGCSSLEVFDHNGTLTKIRHDAFNGCINLVDIDLSTVVTLEVRGLHETGLRSVKLRGEIKYLQGGTVTGEVEEIILGDGFERLSADSVSNTHGHPITWTVPKSVTNIEKGVFKQPDTVVCYNNSIAKSAARISGSDIIIIDKDIVSELPRRLAIDMALDRDIEADIRKLTIRAIERQEIDKDYPIDESRVVRYNLPQEIIDLIGYNFPSGRYATDEDISAEKPKFRCILEYLSKVAKLDATPISQSLLKFRPTFYVDYKMSDSEREAENKTPTRVRGLVYGAAKPTEEYERILETLYDDGVSKVFRIRYVDNKYLSDFSTFIVCKTYDTLRYVCMGNMYTNLLCETYETRDLSELFDMISPGDVLGKSCLINNELYNDVYYESDRTITINEAGFKRTKNLVMNLYQGLKYSSIAVKLDGNILLLIDPSSRMVMKCAALGKTTWLNIKEKTYETDQCTVGAIESLDSLTVIDCASSYNNVQYGKLIEKWIGVLSADRQARQTGQMNGSAIERYVSSYTHILPAVQSMYKVAGDVAFRLNMRNIVDIDLDFVLALFDTPLVDKIQLNWLNTSSGKTVIKAAQSEFKLSDGTVIRQYETATRTALSNKLMVGGDRKVYVFEILSSFDNPEHAYRSLYSFTDLVNMCLKIVNIGKKPERIFVEKGKVDVVMMDSIIEITSLFKNRKESLGDFYHSKGMLILGVYKPNGLYYIGSKVSSGESLYFVPLIQVGELDVVLGLIEASNKLAFSNNTTLDFLIKLNFAASAYAIKFMRGESLFVDSINTIYFDAVKSARDLCIDGVFEVAEYSQLIPEIIKRCMGFSKGDYYKEVKPISEMSDAELSAFKAELAKSESGNTLLNKIRQVLGMEDEEDIDDEEPLDYLFGGPEDEEEEEEEDEETEYVVEPGDDDEPDADDWAYTYKYD